jgi:hypothetical protein
MSTSSKDFIKPLKTTAPPNESAKAPTDSPSDKSMDPRTKEWIHRLAEGMKVLATNEAERRKIDKKVF